jgi:hypothetical protein
MRAGVRRVVTWLVDRSRDLRALPRTIARWLRAHIAHGVASVWVSGVIVFAATGVQRVRAARAAEPANDVQQHAGQPAAAAERVAMLDVDEVNEIRTQRMHANGLAAAGEDRAPDAAAIREAQAARARGIAIEGEEVATAGGVVVVSRGGLAGWLKRNRGKRADPETLAWLRGEEAAEGREAYAGWADRDDASILEWARSRRIAAGGGAGFAATSAAPGCAAPGPAVVASGPGAAGSCAAGSDTAASGTAGTDSDAPTAHAHAAPTRVATGPLAVRGFALPALGAAAARRLVPHAPIDPRPEDIAALRERVAAVAQGAGAVSVRDHAIVLTLLCDRLFEPGSRELARRAVPIVRGLGRLLAEAGRTYRLALDDERAMELASQLAIGGVSAERLEIALVQVDRAIDTAQIEWLDPTAPVASR